MCKWRTYERARLKRLGANGIRNLFGLVCYIHVNRNNKGEHWRVTECSLCMAVWYDYYLLWCVGLGLTLSP